jgi:hypothetical protein
MKLLFLYVTILAAFAACDRSGEEVSLAKAPQYVGERRTVCGTVAKADYFPLSRAEPTYLRLTAPDSPTGFTAVIWGAARKNFANAPEREYQGKQICVTGDIVLYEEKPLIVVSRPKQIEVP